MSQPFLRHIKPAGLKGTHTLWQALSPELDIQCHGISGPDMLTFLQTLIDHFWVWALESADECYMQAEACAIRLKFKMAGYNIPVKEAAAFTKAIMVVVQIHYPGCKRQPKFGVPHAPRLKCLSANVWAGPKPIRDEQHSVRFMWACDRFCSQWPTYAIQTMTPVPGEWDTYQLGLSPSWHVLQNQIAFQKGK